MKQTIENTIKFLQRAELKWNEVPAFVECVNYLTSLLKEKEDVLKTEEKNK